MGDLSIYFVTNWVTVYFLSYIAKYISIFVNQLQPIFNLSYDNVYLNTIKNKFPSF